MAGRLLPVVLVGLLAGCGGVKEAAERMRGENDLKELGLAYLTYQTATHKPPRSMDELAAHAKAGGTPLTPTVARLNVTWGAGMADLCRDGAAAEVVVASAPAAGGRVPALLADGSVRVLGQAEFDAAKKARPLPQ